MLDNGSIYALGNNPFLFDLASVASRISNGSVLAFVAKFQPDYPFKTSKNITNDEKNFYRINPSIKQIIDKASREAEKVRIIGLLDNIGGENHNYNLAMERAKNPKKLLRNGFEIAPKLFNKNNNPNSTPHERVLNRSAWSIIELKMYRKKTSQVSNALVSNHSVFRCRRSIKGNTTALSTRVHHKAFLSVREGTKECPRFSRK